MTLDWTTVIVSTATGIGGAVIVAATTVVVSRGEYRRSAERANVEREHRRLELLAGVQAELDINRRMLDQPTMKAGRTLLLFEVTMMQAASEVISSLPSEGLLRDVLDARYAMLRYNQDAHAMNNTYGNLATGVRPLDDVEQLARDAAGPINKAWGGIGAYLGSARSIA